jgi:hypothetical protein
MRTENQRRRRESVERRSSAAAKNPGTPAPPSDSPRPSTAGAASPASAPKSLFRAPGVLCFCWGVVGFFPTGVHSLVSARARCSPTGPKTPCDAVSEATTSLFTNPSSVGDDDSLGSKDLERNGKDLSAVAGHRRERRDGMVAVHRYDLRCTEDV